MSGGNDVGCKVRLTNPDTGYVRDWDSFYGTKTFQMRDSGTFKPEVSDPGCLLMPLKGNGGVTDLDFTWPADETGDSPVFQSPGAVNVRIGDRRGTSTCELQLRSDADGKTLFIEEADETENSVRLESNGPGLVFIDATSCDYTVSAAR